MQRDVERNLDVIFRKSEKISKFPILKTIMEFKGNNGILEKWSSIYIELILYNINDIIPFMGKRGPKPQCTDVACPNHSCKSYGLTGKGNIVGNGTSVSRGGKRLENTSVATVAKYSMTIQAHSTMISVKRNLSLI